MENNEKVELQLQTVEEVFHALTQRADYHKPSSLYYPDCYIITRDVLVNLKKALYNKYLKAEKR
mgnify:CR=1 FL=1